MQFYTLVSLFDSLLCNMHWYVLLIVQYGYCFVAQSRNRICDHSMCIKKAADRLLAKTYAGLSHFNFTERFNLVASVHKKISLLLLILYGYQYAIMLSSSNTRLFFRFGISWRLLNHLKTCHSTQFEESLYRIGDDTIVVVRIMFTIKNNCVIKSYAV